MSEVLYFALIGLAILMVLMFIGNSWKTSLQYVTNQGQHLHLSGGKQLFWQGIAKVFGPVGKIIFDVTHTDKETDGQMPDSEGVTGGAIVLDEDDGYYTILPTATLYLQITGIVGNEGAKTGSTFQLGYGENYIGRSLVEDDDVQQIQVKGDRAMSSQHLLITIEPSLEITAKVLSNRPGATWLNSQVLTADQEVSLKVGDMLRLGNTHFQLLEGVVPDLDLTIKLLKQYRLTVTDGPDKGKQFNWNSEDLVIGRGSGSGLRLTDNGVSRDHLKLFQDGQLLRLEDLNSSFGVKVNGRLVKKATFKVGSEITIGKATKVVVTEAIAQD